ncbi:MAG TPA: response regulator [Stellaceae bacterium]
MPSQTTRKRRLRRHALVVDREEAICQFVRAVLENVGVDVSCAASAAAARRLLRRRRRFHLALIAVILPDEMGEALALEFTARAVPVVLISGHPEGIRRGPVSGFPFLPKPFRAKDLLRLTLDHIADSAELAR